MNTTALWFLLALAPVVLLYLLKVKREEKQISSTLLWEEVINDLAANTPFQRLRKNLLMFLQLLLLAAVVFSLLRPVVRGASKPTTSTVIIIDNSGSMNALEEGRSRLDMAKSEAQELVGGASSGKANEFMVLAANRDVRTVSSFTDDTSVVSARTAGLEPTELPGNLTDALLIAASAIKNRPDASVYLITDGCEEKVLPNISELSDKLKVIQVGSPVHNLAIMNLAAEQLGEEAAYEVFVSVKNFADEKKATLMTVYDGDDVVDVREISLDPFETRSRSFVMVPNTGTVRCEIDSADALMNDNRAHCLISREKDTPVLLVTSGNIFLTKALGSCDETDTSIVTPSNYTEAMSEDPDVIIFDRWVPDELPRKRCVFVAPTGDIGPVSFGETMKSIIVTDYEEDDPMLRFVGLRDLYINEMSKVMNPESLSPIASSKGTPVMGNFAVGNIEHFLICFDINESEWAVRPSFPMFISNLVENVAASNRMVSSINVPVGSVIEINKKGEKERVFVTFPNGGREEVHGEGANLRFFDTALSGLYRFSIGDTEKLVAVNFFDEIESDVFHRNEISRELPPGTVSSSVGSVSKEIWKWFIIGAFIVSMVEWMCFHRKIQ